MNICVDENAPVMVQLTASYKNLNHYNFSQLSSNSLENYPHHWDSGLQLNTVDSAH